MVIFAMDLICSINYGWQSLRFVPLTYAVCLDEHVPIRFLVSVERRSWCIVPLNQPFLQSDPWEVTVMFLPSAAPTTALAPAHLSPLYGMSFLALASYLFSSFF